MKNKRFQNVPAGADNPLNAAVSARDRSTLQMVEQAVKHQQTLLAFQPVVIANDPKRVGFYEGLIRVMDDTGRIIPAKDFMPVVERAELGREIDVVALNMGMRTLYEHSNIRLSINMSARSIGYQRWMQTMNRWLKKDANIGERLILEITEGSAMDQPELVVDFMDRLSNRGICFALDDFGAGYTALRYFKDFFFDVLKIDMEFCHGIADDPDTQALTSAIIQIGHHFDMLVVAEGVERQEDVRMLTQMGADCLQGFYFQAPQVRPTWLMDKSKTAKRAGQRA
ncbi:EAL domain-containing protein [Tateyamaria sp. ANG-S1]|uniref:EAL domain-containing protein n=1 Tax=Tateyamaria sp. ANG-S1 TaxID=1577905 RepID=UPI00057CC48A|nr:EAL domain-containing protein [Tateyamaria sp. ANG-S1]KIC50328.1 diguanylate phosphodiesterase [Tateyamaria sp. ANG-S1]